MSLAFRQIRLGVSGMSRADSDFVYRSTPLVPPLARGDERGVPLRGIRECSSFRVSVLVCIFSSVILRGLVGCAAGPSATDDGVEDAPAPGEEAGTCFPDGTCNQGLECLDGVCVGVEGEGEGEGEWDTLLIFHNNSGPMCLAALDWLDSMKPEHPGLVVEEHLTYEAGERELLAQRTAEFQTSRGVSTSFEYLPIVFFEGQAFSGFNDEIAEALQELMDSASSASP